MGEGGACFSFCRGKPNAQEGTIYPGAVREVTSFVGHFAHFLFYVLELIFFYSVSARNLPVKHKKTHPKCNARRKTKQNKADWRWRACALRFFVAALGVGCVGCVEVRAGLAGQNQVPDVQVSCRQLPKLSTQCLACDYSGCQPAEQ